MQHDAVDIGFVAGTPVPRGVAKYEYLRATMAAAIEAGHWPPGQQLPPELEIAARTQFSLGTVQRALKELVGQGYVIRRQGSGTFVADRGRRMHEPLHCRFTESGSQKVLPVYTRLDGRRLCTDIGPWSTVLGFDPAGFIMLDRMLDVDGRFCVASRMYMPSSKFGKLMELPQEAFDGVNLKKLLVEEFGVHVQRVEQRIRIATPDAEISNWLGQSSPEPMLTIRASGIKSDGLAVYYQVLWAPQRNEELLVESLVG